VIVYKQRNAEEQAAMDRLDAATEQQQSAYLTLIAHEAPPMDLIDELDAIKAEYLAAVADVNRMGEEIRTGTRP
jgi:hypothetical protein